MTDKADKKLLPLSSETIRSIAENAARYEARLEAEERTPKSSVLAIRTTNTEALERCLARIEADPDEASKIKRINKLFRLSAKFNDEMVDI